VQVGDPAPENETDSVNKFVSRSAPLPNHRQVAAHHANHNQELFAELQIAKAITAGAKQAAEKGTVLGKTAEIIPQGLKPILYYQHFAARLKSGPGYKTCFDRVFPQPVKPISFHSAYGTTEVVP
jgi:hypothetical protein